MVQIGNETNGALAGEKIWFRIQQIMAAGSKACREVYPEALVALHFANPEKAGSYSDYAKKLSASWARGELTGDQMRAALFAYHRSIAEQVRRRD